MKKSYIRIILLLVASALLSMVGTSCNTVRGVGSDVRHVGGHIERAAS